MIDTAMTPARLSTAQSQVYNVCRTGSIITLIKQGSADEFGEILSESTQNLYAFPVRFTPFERRIRERITWAEETDVLCFVSKKEVDDLSIAIETLRRYNYFKFNGKKYDLRYVDFYDAFADDFLYVVIGGKK